jgi:HEAT repeat protein
VATLGDTEEEIRREARALLRRAGSAAVPALITALVRSNRAIIRTGAADILGTVRPIAAEVLSALTNALQDHASEVVSAAAVALKRIESQSMGSTRSRVWQPYELGSLNRSLAPGSKAPLRAGFEKQAK